MQRDLIAPRKAARKRCAAAACLLLAACQPTDQREPRAPRPAPTAALKQTIALADGNQAHVIKMPTDEWESATCLVVTGAAGHVAVACAESRFLLSPDE